MLLESTRSAARCSALTLVLYIRQPWNAPGIPGLLQGYSRNARHGLKENGSTDRRRGRICPHSHPEKIPSTNPLPSDSDRREWCSEFSLMISFGHSPKELEQGTPTVANHHPLYWGSGAKREGGEQTNQPSNKQATNKQSDQSEHSGNQQLQARHRRRKMTCGLGPHLRPRFS